MRRAAHIVVLAVLLAGLCACGHRSRIIPENKLVRIYHDMFLADQWVRDHPETRVDVDTTLLFDPIFHRYGYTFEDYDRTVQYYLDHSERFVKILNRVETQLRKEGEALQQEADRQTARDIELDRYRRGYRTKDFSTDSLRWAGIRPLWPVDTLAAPDTLVARADSLAQADSLRAVELPDPELLPLEKAPRHLKKEIKELTE